MKTFSFISITLLVILMTVGNLNAQAAMNSDQKAGRLKAVVANQYRTQGVDPDTYINGILTGDGSPDYFQGNPDTVLAAFVKIFDVYAANDDRWMKEYGTGTAGAIRALEANRGGKGIIKYVPHSDSVRTCGFNDQGRLRWFNRLPYDMNNDGVTDEAVLCDHLTGKEMFSLFCGNPMRKVKVDVFRFGKSQTTQPITIYVHDTVYVDREVVVSKPGQRQTTKVDTVNGNIYIDIDIDNSSSATANPVVMMPQGQASTGTTYVLDQTPVQQTTVVQQRPQQVRMQQNEPVYVDNGGGYYVRRGVDWYKVADISIGLANLALNGYQTYQLGQLRQNGCWNNGCYVPGAQPPAGGPVGPPNGPVAPPNGRMAYF